MENNLFFERKRKVNSEQFKVYPRGGSKDMFEISNVTDHIMTLSYKFCNHPAATQLNSLIFLLNDKSCPQLFNGTTLFPLTYYIHVHVLTYILMDLNIL